MAMMGGATTSSSRHICLLEVDGESKVLAGLGAKTSQSEDAALLNSAAFTVLRRDLGARLSF